MDKPESCDNKPLMQEVEPGTYFWCSCGKSASQPFCDGAHKGTGFSPVKEVVLEKRKSSGACARTLKMPRIATAHTNSQSRYRAQYLALIIRTEYQRKLTPTPGSPYLHPVRQLYSKSGILTLTLLPAEVVPKKAPLTPALTAVT